MSEDDHGDGIRYAGIYDGGDGMHYDKLGSTESTFEDDHDEQIQQKRGNVCVRYTLGGIALALCLISWDMMAELVQDLQTRFDKPFFIMWSLHSGYMIFLVTVLPAVALGQCICKNTEPIKITWKRFGRATLYNVLLAGSDYVWYISLDHTIPSLNSAIFNTICVFAYLLSIPVLGHKFMWRKLVALLFCLSGMSGILISSLDQSDSPSVNATNTSEYIGCVADDGSEIKPFFELAERDESQTEIERQYTPLCYPKVQDLDENPSGTPIGYVLVIGAVILFAVYEVIFAKIEGHGDLTKKKTRVEAPAATDGTEEGFMHTTSRKKKGLCIKIADTVVTTGLMGLSNFLFLWVVFIILDVTGFEKFNLPFEISSDYKGCCFSIVTGRILINAVLGSIYTSSFLVGVALTDPLFMSIGLILIIPLQFGTDFALGHISSITVGQGLGCGLIIVGFFIINLPMEKFLKKIPSTGKQCLAKIIILASLTFILVVLAVIYAAGVGAKLWY